MADTDSQWYFNPSTGEVSQGKTEGFDDRMGPYASEEEARNAINTAEQRNAAADKADAEDDNWGVVPSWEK